MAAKEIVNNRQNDVEPLVNRWLTDFYFSLALEFFKKEKYEDFLDIRHVLDSVLLRPLEITDVTQIKIRVLQFLSRINEGENLDVSFESDHISPLESALILLEHINQEFCIPQQDFENVSNLLKELILVIYIKNNDFDKAEELLRKHFPKPMVGKKAIFMGLIRKKSKSHEVIEQINFQQFKQEMLAFCQKICPFNVPFLHKAAKMCLEKRLEEPDDKAADPDEESEPGPSYRPQVNTSVKFGPCKQTTITVSRLEAAYKALAAGSNEKSFAQLDQEVKKEEQTARNHSLHQCPTLTKATSQVSQIDVPRQRDSGSPNEALSADQPTQMDVDPQTQVGSLSKMTSVARKRQPYTVARLVMEPDSQCTTASQDREIEFRTEEPPQADVTPNNKDLFNPVTDYEVVVPSRKHPRHDTRIQTRASKSLATLSEDNEEDLHCSVASRETCVGIRHTSLRRNSKKSNQSLSDSKEEESPSSCQTPLKLSNQLSSNPHIKENPISTPARLAGCQTRSLVQTRATGRGDPDNTDEVCITDSSLDCSPSLFPLHPVPQTSSTPHKDSAQDKPKSKWKQLMENAKESKEIWNEDLYFPTTKNRRSSIESTVSNSGQRKKWTESETQKLKEGVKKFGEGNWSKINVYYSFKDRTNVNLKDRWRTMKKSNMV